MPWGKMPELSSVGKWLAGTGFFLVAIGGFFWLDGKFPYLGRLPGDIRIEGGHFKFYFPFTTCVILSVAGSLIFWLFSKLK